MLVYCWYGLYSHCVCNYVLHDVSGRCKQGGNHEPSLNFHDLPHRLGVSNDPIHDTNAERDQARADIDQNRFFAPDQIDQVAKWHF